MKKMIALVASILLLVIFSTPAIGIQTPSTAVSTSTPPDSVASIDIYPAPEEDIPREDYEELQKLAGKIHVHFYQQLLESSNEDSLYEITIIPFFELSPDLEKQIQALYTQYGLDIPPELQGGFPGPVYYDVGDSSHQGQAGTGGADGIDVSPPLSGEGTDSVEPIPADTPPIPEPRDSSDKSGSPQGDDPVSNIDLHPVIPQEFYTTLNELYAQGFSKSLGSLTAHLDSLGLKYRLDMSVIYATATALEILDLRTRQDVLWISNAVYAQDLDYQSPIPGGCDANSGREPALVYGESTRNGATSGSTPYWLYAGGALGLVALAILIISLRKH